MKSAVISSYIEEQYAEIRKSMLDFSKDREPESIHRLRLGIKKLRALFSFLNKVQKDRYPAKAFRKLFDDSGKFREVQVSIQLLKGLSYPAGQLKTMKRMEERLSQQFAAGTPGYVKALGRLKSRLKPDGEVPGKKEVERYFKAQIKKSGKLLRNKKDKNGIHRFRMKVKRIMYVYNMLPGKVRKPLKVNETYINELQEALGRWHDAFFTVALLEGMKLPGALMKELKAKEAAAFVRAMSHCKGFKRRVRLKHV